MKNRSRIPMIALILIATLVLGAGAGAIAYSTFGSSSTLIRQVPVQRSEPAAQTTPLTVGQVYKDAYRSVVEITVTSDQSSPFGGQQQQRAQGSGFVIDNSGHIVTNDHVVAGAKSVSVQFWNGATYKASVMGTDPSTDLGVIKVDAPESVLHPIQFGDSDSVQVGDTTIAIGSPFGLAETVTSGIVSALHRQMEAPNNFTINDSIQTDAAINHGNSGGPLLNINGEVIGVNSQIRSDSGGSDGVGFAIPSNTVKSIADTLIGSGKVEHAYLGVSVQEISASVAGQLKLVSGVEVATVRTGTPAKNAGIRGATGSKTIEGQQYPTGGDVITAIDGQKVTSSEDVQQTIDAHQPGDTVKVTYWRNGDSHTVDVKLATRPTTIPQQ
jgi:S1-C subfamily serine protease